MAHGEARSIDRKGIAICGALIAIYAVVVFAVAPGPFSGQAIVFAQYMGSATITWMIVGYCILIFMMWVAYSQGSDQRPHQLIVSLLARGWTKDRFATVLWPVLLYSALLTLFAIFKQRVLPLAGFRYDELFHKADLAIFGVEPWRLSHSSPWLTEMFGHLYYGWYAPMLLGTLGCAFIVANPTFRQRYLTAFVLTWLIVGSAMAFLLPAAGPCYWGNFVSGPNPYLPLMESLRTDVAASTAYNPVLDAQAYLLNLYDSPTVSFGAGISAMPSMHIALATIFTCGAWSLNRFAGILFAAFAIAIWWASIHLGWHYAVDGLIAAPVALLIWYVSGLIFPSPAAVSTVDGQLGPVKAIKLAGSPA